MWQPLRYLCRPLARRAEPENVRLSNNWSRQSFVQHRARCTRTAAMFKTKASISRVPSGRRVVAPSSHTATKAISQASRTATVVQNAYAPILDLRESSLSKPCELKCELRCELRCVRATGSLDTCPKKLNARHDVLHGFFRLQIVALENVWREVNQLVRLQAMLHRRERTPPDALGRGPHRDADGSAHEAQEGLSALA